MSTVHRRLITELVRLTHQRDIRTGKALHAKIILTNSFSDVHLATSVVNLYAKCDHLAKAKLVFDRITGKSDVSWSAIINTYAQQRTLESYAVVINLFNQMRAENSVPNAYSLAAVFNAVSNVGDVWGGKNVYALAIKTGHSRDVFVASTVLNMYCKLGQVTDARTLFDEMPERTSVTWSIMISGYASRCMAEEAVGLFKMVVTQGGEDEKRYRFYVTGVLSSFAVAKLLDAGRGIHCFAVKAGVALIPEVRNAILTMYIKCEGLSDALQVFSTSADKNPITWSAIITGLAQKGDMKKARELFSEMHFSGVKPSEYTLLGVINACNSDVSCHVRQGKQVHCYSIKAGFETHIYIISSLVDMYSKSGYVADARKCFDSFCEPNVILWTSMISGYVHNGESKEGLHLYARMQAEGVQPDDWTLATVLRGCSSLAALKRGTQMHVHAIKYGSTQKVNVGSSLSSMYIRCGRIDEAIVVFQRMTTRDLFSWNVMISGLVQNGCCDKALEMFEDMRTEDIKPDNFTFIKILKACSYMGLVEKNSEYFKMFSEDYNIVPGLEHYACMVDAYSRAGRLHEAKQFITRAWLIKITRCACGEYY